jgi:hypothetical protein
MISSHITMQKLRPEVNKVAESTSTDVAQMKRCPSGSYEPYEEMMKRVQAAVKSKLASHKRKMIKKTDAKTEKQKKDDRMFMDSSSSEEEEDDLGWEVSSDVSAHPEDLIEFRTDLGTDADTTSRNLI